MSIKFYTNLNNQVATLNEILLHQLGPQYGITQTQGHNRIVFAGTWGALRSLVIDQIGSRMGPEYVQIYNSPLYEVTMNVGVGEGRTSFTAYSQRLALDLGTSHSADSIPVTIIFDRITPRPMTGPGSTQAPIKGQTAGQTTGQTKVPTKPPTVEGFRRGCDPNNVFYYLLLFVLIMLALFILYYLGCAAAGAMAKKH